LLFDLDTQFLFISGIYLIVGLAFLSVAHITPCTVVSHCVKSVYTWRSSANLWQPGFLSSTGNSW